MLTLLIADDEYFILERLKRVINYRESGFDLIATASNGRDTLTQIEDLKPDLAIIDIKMPFMSGLEIAKYVYDKKLPTKIVILTSYDYFDFAIQAIHSQVFAYLLKPVNAEELKNILNNVSFSITEQKTKEAKLQEYSQLQLETALQQFLSCDNPAVVSENIYKEIPGIVFVKHILFIKLDSLENHTDFSFSIQKLLNKILPVEYFFLSCSDHIFCLLLKTDVCIDEMLITLQTQLQHTFHVTVNIVISKKIQNTDNLPQIYKEALVALYYTIFQGENSIKKIDYTQHTTKEQTLLSYEIRDSIITAVKSANPAMLHTLLCGAFAKLAQFPSLQNMEILISEVIIASSSLSSFVDTENPYVLSFYIHELIDSKNSLTGIREWCEQYLSGLMLTEEKRNNETHVAASVMNLIQETYQDVKLSLPYIADRMGYTPNYISNVFKRSTGLTVIQYITQYRMKMAHKMLSMDHLPVNKVYQLVGYSNAFYFSKRFKAFYGYSPSECK